MANEPTKPSGSDAKGHPKNDREKTETVLEEGLPPELQRRGTKKPSEEKANPPRRTGSQSP